MLRRYSAGMSTLRALVQLVVATAGLLALLVLTAALILVVAAAAAAPFDVTAPLIDQPHSLADVAVLGASFLALQYAMVMVGKAVSAE